MNTPRGTSLDDLHDFLSTAATATTLSKRTIDAYRLATRSIQEIIGIASTADIHDLDLDAVLDRFHAQTADRFTQHTRNTYESNFRRAIETFSGWIDHDHDWQSVQGRYRRPAAGARTHEMYRFPLRPDDTLDLRLPYDLTRTEANRIAAFVNALVNTDNTDPSSPDARSASAG
jgi:hypothetical protein